MSDDLLPRAIKDDTDRVFNADRMLGVLMQLQKRGHMESGKNLTAEAIWRVAHEKTYRDTDISLQARQPNGGNWFWMANDQENDGELIAVSTMPGFDTAEQAMEAADQWYINRWLPHYKATGEREALSSPDASIEMSRCPVCDGAGEVHTTSGWDIKCSHCGGIGEINPAGLW